MKIVKEESKGADVEMIDTSSAKTTAKANSWDVLCNIRSEIQGTSEAEIEKKLRLTINTLFKVLTNI
jgi:hypothetical protein